MTITSTPFEYSDGEIVSKTRYFSPANTSGPLPIILVCPAWDGVVQEVMDKATRLAGLGYIALVVDVFGNGKTLSDTADMLPTLTPYFEDRAMLLGRLKAALAAAKTIPGADLTRIGAIGYCFGGTCALDLARSGGPDIKAVVSFHGGLAPNDLASTAISASVLVLHGQADPLVPPAQVAAFEQEMTERGADWQLHSYGNTLHAFTRPDANNPDFGALYSPDADRRSWQAMSNFFAEVF